MPSILASMPWLPSFGSSTANIALYSLGALVTALLSAYLYLWTWREWSLVYKNLPGPPRNHWLLGNLSQIVKVEPGLMHEQWAKEFGLTFRYKIVLGQNRVCSADPVTLNYILSHHEKFPKPALTRRFLTDMLGEGVLVAEGNVHRRQRRILNPSFSPQSIRDVMPVFYDKALELKEKLLGLIEEDTLNVASPTPAKQEDAVAGGRKIDVMKFLGQCTIDVIGIAGFNYDFKALSQPKNELAEAFNKMFSAGQNFNAMAIIQAFVPGMSKLPTERQKTVWASKATTQRIGRRLIEEKKWAIQQAHTGGFEKGDDIGKDLLSTCIRANMAADLKPEHRLSDDEVLAQITTFLLAGNETSSTALTWILYMLTQNPDCQARLRKECLSVAEERPSMEEISALPYLGAVVHEGLRLLSPVQGTIREAAEDVVLPLGSPVRGRDGQMLDHIRISKGTQIFLPISTINTSEDIWGPDAKTFNPLRHISPADGGTADEKLRAAQNAVPSTFGNMLTFLAGGRNCIGYRFALAEIKVILFVLLRGLEFEELASKPKVEKKSAIVMRPRIIGEEAAGLQMPLMVKPLTQA